MAQLLCDITGAPVRRGSIQPFALIALDGIRKEFTLDIDGPSRVIVSATIGESVLAAIMEPAPIFTKRRAIVDNA